MTHLAILLALQLTAADYKDPSPHRIEFVTVADGVRVEVLDWGGSGRPVVFLAGYLTAHAYDEISPKLTDAAHVYGITRRGLGASSKPPSGYSAKESAADVVRALDALKLEKPLLVGHSFGGQDAGVIGAEYPDRISGIVYLDSAEDISLGPVSAAASSPANLPETQRTPFKPDMSSIAAYRESQRKGAGMAFPESEVRQLHEVNPDGTLGRYLVAKEVRDAMFKGLLSSPPYGRIRVPVLALYATPPPLDEQIKRHKPANIEEAAAMGFKYGLDLAWAARNGDSLKRGIPGARVVEVPGAKTYIFLTNEADVLRELRAFLAHP